MQNIWVVEYGDTYEGAYKSWYFSKKPNHSKIIEVMGPNYPDSKFILKNVQTANVIYERYSDSKGHVYISLEEVKLL